MAAEWITLILLSIVSIYRINNDGWRRQLAWILPATGVTLLALNSSQPPWMRLLAASAGMLILMKCAVVLTFPKEEIAHLKPAAYWLWPGMDPERLALRRRPEQEDAYPIRRGLIYIYAGLVLLIAAAMFRMPSVIAGWLTLFGLLFIIHFGLSEILTSGFRLSGIPVRPLFDRPFASQTLNEFWTKRWNIAFVEMDRRLFLPPFLKRFGLRGALLGVFAVSGLLHEMAISYPAGGGWGLPTIYFLLQGLLVLAERRFRIRSRLFVWASVLGPLPLVFTAQFRTAFMSPVSETIHRWLTEQPVAWYFDRFLWVMGAAHFLVLVASFQVPSKLNWREELVRLSSFNRKLMYAYGAFIVLTIVTFGVFTLTFHKDLLGGTPAALFFAGFIAVFWLLRIGMDAFYYKHDDWPKGAQFVVGHALLTSLFAFLSLSYGSLVVWRLLS